MSYHSLQTIYKALEIMTCNAETHAEEFRDQLRNYTVDTPYNVVAETEQLYNYWFFTAENYKDAMNEVQEQLTHIRCKLEDSRRKDK